MHRCTWIAKFPSSACKIILLLEQSNDDWPEVDELVRGEIAPASPRDNDTRMNITTSLS